MEVLLNKEWLNKEWLNTECISSNAISSYRKTLRTSCPNHVVIDGLFDNAKLNEVVAELQTSSQWHTQQHTYSALYVDEDSWRDSDEDERFVQRDVWQRELSKAYSTKQHCNEPQTAQAFLSYLRSHEFLSLLSRIFGVALTDKNVAEPNINTNYFRLGADDFVEQHADDSPGREVCMLLYLNQDWTKECGGELVFSAASTEGCDLDGNDIQGNDINKLVKIAPLFNRCVLFDPASSGAEHWVERLKSKSVAAYRYNVTSWYWTE